MGLLTKEEAVASAIKRSVLATVIPDEVFELKGLGSEYQEEILAHWLQELSEQYKLKGSIPIESRNGVSAGYLIGVMLIVEKRSSK